MNESASGVSVIFPDYNISTIPDGINYHYQAYAILKGNYNFTGSYILLALKTCWKDSDLNTQIDSFGQVKLYEYGNNSILHAFDSSDKRKIWFVDQSNELFFYFHGESEWTNHLLIQFYARSWSPIYLCDAALVIDYAGAFQKPYYALPTIFVKFEVVLLPNQSMNLRILCDRHLIKGDYIYLWILYPISVELVTNVESDFLNMSLLEQKYHSFVYKGKLLENANKEDGILINFQGRVDNNQVVKCEVYAGVDSLFSDPSKTLSTKGIISITLGSIALLAMIVYLIQKYRNRESRVQKYSITSTIAAEDGSSYTRNSNSTLTTLPSTIH
jgi:hypothetical protein